MLTIENLQNYALLNITLGNIMLLGALANNIYERDHATVIELKSTLKQIIYQIKIGEFQKNLEDPEGAGKMGGSNSQGPIYATYLELFRVKKLQMGEEYTDQNLLSHIEECVRQLEFLIEKLKFLDNR